MAIPIDMLDGPDALRAMLRDMDPAGVLAQELVQKGAMHAVRFVIEHVESGGDALQVLRVMRQSLRENAMIISEECAKRGMPVVQENG